MTISLILIGDLALTRNVYAITDNNEIILMNKNQHLTNLSFVVDYLASLKHSVLIRTYIRYTFADEIKQIHWSKRYKFERINICRE